MSITIHNLSRVYSTTTGIFKKTKKEIRALNQINLEVQPGELFGLLGPNGAGKTTLTRILATALLPTAGEAKVFGLDVVKDAKQIRPRIGIVFGGDRGLYWRLSGYDNLDYFATLYNLPTEISRQRIPEMLELVGLADRADERVEGYSRGMKQRLHIARSLLHDPELLFLDEPTIGLDPVAAREQRKVIQNLKTAGKTIFLTSHYMFEVDELCDKVAILKQGSILVSDTPASLKKLVTDLEVIEFECFGVPPERIAKIREHHLVISVNVVTEGQSQIVQVQAPVGADLVQDLLAILNGIQVRKINSRQPTLEDAYVKLMDGETKIRV
jgi:ABC-2 type transport system ATP-binding protein